MKRAMKSLTHDRELNQTRRVAIHNGADVQHGAEACQGAGRVEKDHTIEIKALSREAGYRTKIAVSSIDLKVDCPISLTAVKGSPLLLISRIISAP